MERKKETVVGYLLATAFGLFLLWTRYPILIEVGKFLIGTELLFFVMGSEIFLSDLFSGPLSLGEWISFLIFFGVKFWASIVFGRVAYWFFPRFFD